MKRKDFLQRLLPVGLAAFPFPSVFSQHHPHKVPASAKAPPYLKPGDTIGITCPAGPMTIEDMEDCFKALQSWGFRMKTGNTISTQWQRFSATDEQRLEDLQQLLDDDGVSAIMFGRGGYGVVRIIDKIDWSKFVKKPKWLIGYSDITTLHCHLARHYGIPSIHADMANGFGDEIDDAALTILHVLTGYPINYTFSGSSYNIPGNVSGQLIGGNLSAIYALQASNSQIETSGKILMIEDVEEYKYTIDRMLMNLKRSGMLKNLAGLAVGSFSRMKTDGDEEFTMTIEEVVLDHVKEYGYPVCFNFPAGHQKMNLALKLGISYGLQVEQYSCRLMESGISG